MGLAEEIARVRMKARGVEINARHRRGREAAARVAGAMGPPAPPDGIHPKFAESLEAARKQAKDTVLRAESKRNPPVDRIDQLVREGKLPPRPNSGGVGYEPTPEEVLGDLAEATAPEGTEDLPDAATVLAGDAGEASGEWGQPPGAPAPRSAVGAPGAPSGPPGLARPAASVHSKRKRGK